MNPPYIGPQTKLIRLKLFLDTVPSSSAEITRALRGYFRGGQFMFRFVSMQRKTSNAVDMSFFHILITRKGGSALCMSKYISKL